MPVESSRCDERNITRFLEHELSDSEQRELERHLEHCPACSNRLVDATANAESWKRTRSYLHDDPFELAPLSDGVCGTRVDEIGGDIASDAHRVIELLAPTDDPRRLGRIGAYEIAGLVGSGGMGVVLKGFDGALNRYVAIKVLAPHLGSSAASRKRFSREAQAAAAVVHDNVIEIHGVASLGGLPYFVMPYVRGASLQKRLDVHGPLSVVEILRIGKQAASGLAAAHAQGLVHRDIKPANILLADGVERVKLTDFGLARAADDASLTRTGVIAGTPQFMSPEQARGETVDHRSDLFGLGSVLYAMCTGHPPFRADSSYGILRRITDCHARPIIEQNPEIPAWLCRIVEKLHAKSPEDRFESAVEVAELLEQCLAHVQQPASEDLPLSLRKMTPRGRKTSSRRTRVMSLGVVGALAVVVAVLGSTFGGTSRAPESKKVEQPTADRSDVDLSARDVQPSVVSQDELKWNDEAAESLAEVGRGLRGLDARSLDFFDRAPRLDSVDPSTDPTR